MNPATAVSGVVLLIGLASFGVLAWALRYLMLLDRALDAGDIAVLSVFAIFGSFCGYVGWRLYRSAGHESTEPDTSDGVGETAPPRRVTLSQGCATVGVLLLMLSVLLPSDWYPVVLLFLGLALLAVSHALTPCDERLAKLRRARASMRQL